MIVFVVLFGVSVLVSRRCFHKIWQIRKQAKNDKIVNDKEASAVSKNTQNFKVDPSLNHIFVSKTSERKISIINTPLPPAPVHGDQAVTIMRLKSKNSIVSDDVDFLTPRVDIGLQSGNDIENDYDAPTFYSKNDTKDMKKYNSSGMTDNYIPMKNY